jgi:endonuclease YncB( thermonuclease family)
MKKLALLALIFVAQVEANQVVTGKVVRVHDGDTVTMNVGNEQLNIRLARIDAPELKQPFGKESGDWLREVVDGETVTVDIEKIDRYGRAVGTIMMGNENVNMLMVEDGYAWVYREYSNGGDDLMLLEKDAKAHGKGLWADAEPIYPSDFRKAAKVKK